MLFRENPQKTVSFFVAAKSKYTVFLCDNFNASQLFNLEKTDAKARKSLADAGDKSTDCAALPIPESGCGF